MIPDEALKAGRRFVSAIERQSWEELAELFDTAVQFRALIPGGLRTADDRESAVRYLQKWFGDANPLVLLSSSVEMVEDRVHMAYRFRVREDQWYLVEQQAYSTIQEGRIVKMDLLCSGFRRESVREPS